MPSAPEVERDVTLEIRGKVALITLNREGKLNAMDPDRYFRLAKLMIEVGAMPDIAVTVLTGKGRFFSAYVKMDIGQCGRAQWLTCRPQWC